MIQHLSETKPTARKAHRCSTCLGPISAGETYRREKLIADDGPYEWKTCAACDTDLITNRVHAAGYEDGYGVGPEEAHEWATDHAGDPVADRYLERYGSVTAASPHTCKA